ncbi:hypothetical protein C725_1317 [Pacificimonas flava]|uniref:Uncharacterized protein n=1 Tax=Pacificimonas flava TaxID=1234595 RepID=M2TNV9_9SPHN|nr:hypothetical protein C725_1317 [Pacificimonas flava]
MVTDLGDLRRSRLAGGAALVQLVVFDVCHDRCLAEGAGRQKRGRGCSFAPQRHPGESRDPRHCSAPSDEAGPYWSGSRPSPG